MTRGDLLLCFASSSSFRRKPESILISRSFVRARASTVLRPAGNSPLVITRCIRSSPSGPFAARMFAAASCLRSPAKAGIQFFLSPAKARASTVLRPAGNFLDSGHPALRPFGASFAVRAAPAAQCWCKESHQRNTFSNLSRPRFDARNSESLRRPQLRVRRGSVAAESHACRNPHRSAALQTMLLKAAHVPCPSHVARGAARHRTHAQRQTLGRTPRAFFSGDSFLYTSKEKSYPLAEG